MSTLNDGVSKTRRILCVIVFALAYAAPNFAQYQFSPLGPQIMERFALSPEQFSSLITAPILPAIFLGFISGMMVDRFGYKPILAVAIALTAIGAWCRHLSVSYAMMFAAMVMMGFSAAFISANGAKILSNFFHPDRIGVVMGIVLTITTTGMVLSMLTTTPLGMYRAFLLAACLASLVLILWIVVMPNLKPVRKETADGAKLTLGQSVLAVLKNRYVWNTGIVIFFINACMTGMGHSIPTALMEERGFTESAAGVAGAFLMVGNLLGSLITPTISLKTGKFRLVLIICGAVAALGCCFAWRLPGILLYVGLVLTGYCFGSGMAQTLSLSVRLPGVGPALAGTAGGLISTLDLLGAVLMPAHVAAPIAGGYNGVFFLILGIFAIPWMIGVAVLPKSLDIKG